MTQKKQIKAGDVIGHWQVLEESILTDTGSVRWLCRCTCGTERYVPENSLRYGGSRSCGCQRQNRVPDLTGRQFGQLTVLCRIENTRSGAARWKCRCSCGEECSATTSQLRNGRKQHCASTVHEKQYAYRNIAGQRFDQLTALYPTNRVDARGYMIWHCSCDCGKEADISYNSLMYGNQKSCGCRKRAHEQKLNAYLIHTAGTSMDMLKSKKLPTDNTTGCKGVYLVRGKYMAKIVFQKKQYFLGYYEDFEDAVQARKKAEELLFDAAAEHYARWKQYADRDPGWAKENPVQIRVEKHRGQLQVVLQPDLKAYVAEECGAG